MNRLAKEKSPYLLQHARNPVDWFPWGEEAFAEGLRRDVPIFLSIGYSTCHWCHVMEHESFEDAEIAKFLNDRFVSIKVDREERPDVDALHMKVVQSLTGQGGWPMSVWLTPEKIPFYGGTYFPPRDGDRGARFGFLTVLSELDRSWREGRPKILSQASRIAESLLHEMHRPPARPADPDGADVPLAAARAHYRRAFDAQWGGWGSAPKFPRSDVVELLLATGDAEDREAARFTLERMRRGGIYDHLAGGFHRYATDGRWQVPHFEKMLYDNAQLARAYLAGFQATRDEDFATVARETLAYLMREMRHLDGAFYCATDADSEGEEGKYFFWTAKEIEAVLGPGGAERAGIVIEEDVLRADRPIPPEARGALSAVRARRVPPMRDEKILASWNGLAISAFARSARILDDANHLDAARRAADFLWTNLRDGDGRLLSRWMDGEARHLGYLDDYAFFIEGLLDLLEADPDPVHLLRAEDLARRVLSEFGAEGGGFYFTSERHERLLARDLPDHDGATPSGNSVMAMNLLRLAALTDHAAYRAAAEGVFRALGGVLAEFPIALPRLLLAGDFARGPVREIVLVHGEGTKEMEATLARTLPPRSVLLSGSEGELARLSDRIPMIEGKRAIGGKATVYLCSNRVCGEPIVDPSALAAALRG